MVSAKANTGREHLEWSNCIRMSHRYDGGIDLYKARKLIMEAEQEYMARCPLINRYVRYLNV